MAAEEKKVSQIGFKLSEVAYKNTKRMYHFTMFFLPGIEDLTLNDFILLITIIYASLRRLEKFAVLKYPYSRNVFTAVRVPREIKTQIENLWKRENEDKNDNRKINLSEIIPSILERLNNEDTWVSLFAILYLISFINETFGEFISKEEKENFTKRLILPDFIKKNADTIFAFFSDKFYDCLYSTGSDTSSDCLERFEQATEKIVIACNTRYKELYGDSLKEYHSVIMWPKFVNIWQNVTAIYIIFKEVAYTREINPKLFNGHLVHTEETLYHILLGGILLDQGEETETGQLLRVYKDTLKHSLLEAPKLFAYRWNYFRLVSLKFLTQL